MQDRIELTVSISTEDYLLSAHYARLFGYFSVGEFLNALLNTALLEQWDRAGLPRKGSDGPPPSCGDLDGDLPF